MKGYMCDRCKKEFKEGYRICYDINRGFISDDKWYDTIESCDTNYLCLECKPLVASELFKVIK